jgi:HPt (histidine-containing phosphotransfer) domain-containing protein
VIASDQLALEIQNAETPKAAKLPESLPSIDLQDGLERCQGNQKLYLKLLGDFIRNYGASAAQMKTMLETGDLDSLAKLAHTLKGLSANLGAKTLSTQAMQLEHIADIRDNEQAGAIEEFSLVLTTLTQELESLLKTMQESDQNQDVQVRCFSNEERKVFLESLAGMINEQKMDAYDQAVEAAEKWPDDLAKDELNQLIEQLDLFEFDSAKQSLENIKSMIQ